MHHTLYYNMYIRRVLNDLYEQYRADRPAADTADALLV